MNVMARVTVEDCVKKIPNRFDLVIAAAQRSREISNGIAIEVTEIMIKTQLYHYVKLLLKP